MLDFDGRHGADLHGIEAVDLNFRVFSVHSYEVLS